MATARRALIVDNGTITQVADSDALVHLPQPLSAPRVTHLSSLGTHAGLTRNGNAITCYGGVRVTIIGLPEEYRTNPDFRCQIVLFRHKPATRKLTRHYGYIHKGAGWYNPSPYLTYRSSSGGIGGGGGGGTTPRPSVWSVVPDGPFTGLPYGGGFTFLIGDVFAPWFEIMHDVTDQYQVQASHATLSTLCYFIGNNKHHSTRGIFSHNRGPFLGVFAFAFRVWDAVNNRWHNGPLSDTVYVRPAIWPVVEDASTPYPYKRRINLPQRSGHLELIGSVGARRT
jgi:hypothetical protein